MRAILSIFAILSLIGSAVTAENIKPTETIILAVDVSKTMRHSLVNVKSAAVEFIQRLDTEKEFRVVVLKFGTFADVVVEKMVRSEADKDHLKSGIMSLKADQDDTNFDEAFDAIELKMRRMGAETACILVYSDGLSEPTPGSGKAKVSLEEQAARKFPVGKFSVYLIELNPKAAPMPEDVLGSVRRSDGSYPAIDVRPEDLESVTSRIRGDIENKFDEMMKRMEELQVAEEQAQAVAQQEVSEEPSPGFIRRHWKPALLLGIIALSLMGYGIYWAFIAEDPAAKKTEHRPEIEKRAQFTILESNGRPYTARITDGNRIKIGNSSQCQVRVNVPDSVAAYVVFERDRAYLVREGRSQVYIDDETVKNRMELNSGDTVKVGQESIEFQIVSAGGNGNSIDELLRQYGG